MIQKMAFVTASEQSNRVLAEGARVLSEGTRVLFGATRILFGGTRVHFEGTRVRSKSTQVLSEGTGFLSKGNRVRSKRTTLSKKGTGGLKLRTAVGNQLLRVAPIALLVLTASCLSALGQKVDTVVNMGIYKSYFSYDLKQPLYVTYTLYQGGGGCDRNDESFSFKKCGVNTASDEDYTGFGLDKGHLANAEDFAYDCDLEEKTFCYFNCVPQTVKLNRGIWKTWEEKTRVLSHTKKVFVIAGAIYKHKTQGPHSVGVPEWCYKIVLNAKTKKVIYCVLFPNDNSKTAQEITLSKLKKKLGYGLMP